MTITLHVVSSVDGFIARHDNTVEWLDSPPDAYERGVSHEEAGNALPPIDCFVLGSHTYEHALQLGWPYGDTPTVVVTSRELSRAKESVELHSGDLERLVTDRLAPRFQNVWLVGGAILSQEFLRLGLVDEIRLSIAPVLLGQGLSLFGGAGDETRWRLKDVVTYNTGFVELVVVRKGTGLKSFDNEWICQAFDAHPSYFTKRMFGGLAIYVFERLMLILVEPTKTGRWNWHGVLVGTDRDRHAAILREFPNLAPHDVLKKWLYIDSRQPEFESTMERVAKAVARNDPRFGVQPRPRKKG